MSDFVGKHVVITGAANGIGEACARQLHSLGARLTLIDKEPEALAQVARELSAAMRVQNLSDTAAIHELAATIDAPDVLVNNAGFNIDASLLAFHDQQIHELVAVNFLAPIFMMRAFGHGMLERRSGVVVNVSSQLAFCGAADRAIYGACKAAIVHLTRSLAAEWGPHGVRVVGIAPGRTATRMTEQIRATQPSDELNQTVPLRRFGQPNEIADAVCFMASDHASYVNGTTLIVDGGYLAV